MTKEELSAKYDAYVEYRTHAFEVAAEYAAIWKKSFDPEVANLQEHTLEDDFIFFQWEEFSYGDHDTYEVYVPTRYLWTDGWQKEAKEDYEKHVQELERQRKAQNRDREYRMYQELKKRFENDSP